MWSESSCKHCKFGEKIYYHSRDIEFFLGVPFLLVCPAEDFDKLCAVLAVISDVTFCQLLLCNKKPSYR